MRNARSKPIVVPLGILVSIASAAKALAPDEIAFRALY